MKEIDMALGKPDLPAIPVVIDEDGKSLIPPTLADIQWLDLSDPTTYETNLRRFASFLLGASQVPEIPKSSSGDVHVIPPSGELHVIPGSASVSIETLVGRLGDFDVNKLAKLIAVEVAANIANINARPNQKARDNTLQGEIMDSSEKDNLVFVVMAFTEDMEPVFEGIRDAAKTVGLEAKRVKDVLGDYQITTNLIDMLRASSMVVVDLSYDRPNVYFELGYARGIGKTVITTARSGTQLQFDVKDWTCTFYSDSRLLERSLKERFKIELNNIRTGSRSIKR